MTRLPPSFNNLLPLIYKVNHRLAFYKRANEPFIEAANLYDDEQSWLKNQINRSEPIWQVGPIFPSTLEDIVDSRVGVEDTTFEAKAKDRLLRTDFLEAKNWNRRGQGPRTQFF